MNSLRFSGACFHAYGNHGVIIEFKFLSLKKYFQRYILIPNVNYFNLDLLINFELNNRIK